MHTESWLYRNYQKPLDESDTNGLIVAFDPSRKNALLHQQVTALQEDTQFDRRVMAKADTRTALQRVAEQAWADGYEHLTVLTAPERISEVDGFLQRYCSQSFESVQVVPENSPRLHEAELDDMLGPATQQAPQQQNQQAAFQQNQQQNQQGQAQPQQQQDPQQQEEPQEEEQAGKPISLFLVSANPPVTGTDKILEQGQKLLAQQKATNAHYAFHNTGIDPKYRFSVGLRSSLVKGDDRESMPSLYGKNGIKAINDLMKMNGRSAIHLEGGDIATVLQQHPDLQKMQIQYIAVPEDVLPNINLGDFDQNRVITVPGKGDMFTPQHKALIDLGRQIAKESEKPKKENKDDDKEEAPTFAKEEITQEDKIALHIINACVLAESMSGEQMTKQLRLSWGELDAGTKEFAQEFGKSTGIGDMVSGAKGMADLVTKSVKSEEVNKGAAMQAQLNSLQALSFDGMKAVNHPQYKKFFDGLDLA